MECHLKGLFYSQFLRIDKLNALKSHEMSKSNKRRVSHKRIGEQNKLKK